jgi:hypothetical protein
VTRDYNRPGDHKVRFIKITWSGQWALDAWPNFLTTIILMTIAFYLAWKRGRSPFEMIYKQVDRAFVETFRKRFGKPR